jgi:hypothetical protein
MRIPLVAAAVAAAVALAACGEKTIDADKGEKFIRDTIAEQVGARVASVTCPEGVEAKKGGTFNCVVVGRDRTRGEVVARQKDDEGNVEVNAPFLHVRQAEAVMANEIGSRVKAEIEVACPEIVVVAKGETFTCKAGSEGRTRDVAVRLIDAAGRFNYRLS